MNASLLSKNMPWRKLGRLVPFCKMDSVQKLNVKGITTTTLHSINTFFQKKLFHSWKQTFWKFKLSAIDESTKVIERCTFSLCEVYLEITNNESTGAKDF